MEDTNVTKPNISKIKKETPKKQPKPKKNNNSNWSVFLIIGVVSIGLAVGAYFLLLNQEKKALDEGEKSVVYLTTTDMAKGSMVSSTTLTTKSVIVDLVPSTAITKDTEEKLLDGSMVLSIDAKKNTILTSDMLVPAGEMGDKEIGIATESLASAINGILRAADYVDIYIIPENYDPTHEEYVESEENSDNAEVKTFSDFNVLPTFEHVFVSSVYNSDGAHIINEDTESIVSNFNVVLNSEDANYLVGALQKGLVYIVKCKDHSLVPYTSNIQIIEYIDEDEYQYEEEITDNSETEIIDNNVEAEVEDEMETETTDVVENIDEPTDVVTE